MANMELKIAREKTKQLMIEQFGRGVSGLKDLLINSMSQPLLQMIWALALIELGQRIYLDKERHQLITENIGNALDGIILTAGTIEMLAKSAVGVAEAVQAFKGAGAGASAS